MIFAVFLAPGPLPFDSSEIFLHFGGGDALANLIVHSVLDIFHFLSTFFEKIQNHQKLYFFSFPRPRDHQIRIQCKILRLKMGLRPQNNDF